MSFAKLSREMIVDEAIALMQDEGLEQVTLRSVAGRLDVQAPSLYRHIASKAALHALMSERIYRRCLEAVPDCATWQEWLRAFGHALWKAQADHAGVLRLIQVRAGDGGVMIALRDQVVATLVARGMDAETALLAQRSVQALVTGWTTLRRTSGSSGGETGLLIAIDTLVDGWGNHTKLPSGG